MYNSFQSHLNELLDSIRTAGTYKRERIITTPQSARIQVANGQSVLNFCANNYLGLAGHPAVVEAAREALDRHGYGMASVRFICRTHDVHNELEARLSEVHRIEDDILYSSCFYLHVRPVQTLLDDGD